MHTYICIDSGTSNDGPELQNKIKAKRVREYIYVFNAKLRCCRLLKRYYWIYNK